MMMNNPSPSNKSAYSKLNKSVKYQVKQWKRKLLEKEVVEMEDAFAKNNSHELFKKVRKLSGEKAKQETHESVACSKIVFIIITRLEKKTSGSMDDLGDR